MLASNTTGFDIYHHSISASGLSLIRYYNPPWSISGFEIPRYILLQYSFWAATLFGVLPLIPLLALLYAYLINLLINSNIKYMIVRYAIVVIAMINIVFTSALGISLFLIAAGVLDSTKNMRSNCLIISGSLFHPVGFLLGFIVLSVSRKWRPLIILMALLYFSHLVAILPSGNSSYPIRSFHFSDLLEESSYINQKMASKIAVEVFFAGLLIVGVNLFYFLGRSLGLNSVMASMDVLFKRSYLKLLIYSFVASVLVLSYRAQVVTGGPIAVLSMQTNGFRRETFNMVSGAWVSPLLLNDSIRQNQYLFRGD
jgi:hypothetical protein